LKSKKRWPGFEEGRHQVLPGAAAGPGGIGGATAPHGPPDSNEGQMSIVNEALKKASRAKDRTEQRKFFQQEQWVLSVTALKWRRSLLYGGVTSAIIVIAVFSWWALQKLPISQKGLTLTGGAIHTLAPSLASMPKTSALQPDISETQASKISDHYQRGLAHYNEKRFNEAEKQFTAILAVDPNQAVAHNNLGLVYHAQGRDKEAVIEYLAALRINPSLAEAMNNLGLLYDQQGRAEEAVNLYERALKINPDYSEAHLNYAIILERLGYLEEARKHYQSFLSLAPGNLGDVVASVQARLPNLP